MPAVSQALLEFANHHRTEAAPGVEVTVTSRYQITLQPDFPIPGPNSVAWVRCRPDEVDGVIREARATIAPRHLPIMWTVDPETEPSDFGDHLARYGIHPDPGGEVAVMVLPIGATVDAEGVPGLEILDGLADLDTFRKADAVNAEAFESESRDDDLSRAAMQERRRLNALAAGNRRLLLATVEGEPAGSAGLSLYPPAAAILNGGAVRPKFRSQGIYRALVAARMDIARTAGVDGLCVWGGHMSAPILTKLGFEKVSWRRFYLDTSTA